MAKPYTEEEFKIFAHAYVMNGHNQAEAYKAIRPSATTDSASHLGSRLFNKVQVKQLIEQYEEEYSRKQEQLRKEKMHQKSLSNEEVDSLHCDVIRLLAAMNDPQSLALLARYMDMYYKKQGVYSEKRQIEVGRSLADILLGVTDDA